MTDTYKTIAAPAEGQYSEKRSRFLAFAFPVRTIDDIKAHVERLRKQYFDARHVCYAYMLGADRTEFRANDDGEPSSTAGKPILGQINSAELSDILIVVVRYYGGVNLGTGGLIVAYRTAAAEAIAAAEIVERVVEGVVRCTFPFDLTNVVMRLVKDSGAKVMAQDYDANCTLTLSMPRSQCEQLALRLRSIYGVMRIEQQAQ